LIAPRSSTLGAASPALMLLLLLLGFWSSASCLHAPPTRPGKQQFDAAFTSWREQQLFAERKSSFFLEAERRATTLLQSKVNRLAHPDVPVHLIFEGNAEPTVLPGTATTDILYDEATRLHNLDANQKLRFVLNGTALPMNIPISESSLANSYNLEVLIMAANAVQVRRAVGTTSGDSWWSGASTGGGQRRTASARAAERAHNQPASLKAFIAAQQECSIAADLKSRVRVLQEDDGSLGGETGSRRHKPHSSDGLNNWHQDDWI